MENKELTNINESKRILDIGLKVLHFVFLGFLGLLFLLTLWLALNKFILKKPVTFVFGYSVLSIETGSMNGTSVIVEGENPAQINIGDLILIKKTNDYKIGDVITYIHEGEKIPTTHRIIGYTSDGYITKGDANNTSDTLPVLKEEVLGEVVGHYPKLGKFVSWIKIDGWIYLVGGFAVLAIGIFLLNLTNEEEQNDEEKIDL